MGLRNLFGRSKPKKETKVVVVELKNVKNFKYLDDLIHSGKKEIKLDADILLGDSEKNKYADGIEISDDLIINGNGHIIDACAKTRIFNSNKKNFTIKNLTLKNGFSKVDGGAMRCFGGKIVIENCTFDNNITRRESGCGGAIYHNGGEMTIKSSSFKNNKVIGDYGNGAAINASSDLTITNSIFSANIIAGDVGNGGAIYAQGKIRVNDSEFSHNIASSTCGAIHCYGNGNVAKNCKFTKNMAKMQQHFDSIHLAAIDCDYDYTEYDKNKVDLLIAMALR